MDSVIVIGTSPYAESVAVGPFGVPEFMAHAMNVSENLQHKGYVTELVPLMDIWNVPMVVNDEGKEE